MKSWLRRLGRDDLSETTWLSQPARKIRRPNGTDPRNVRPQRGLSSNVDTQGFLN
ncbi:hypothetical protein ABIE45_000694 [Methylobacterium sp. OAE515]